MTGMSVEQAAKVDVKKMSKTERMELRRIVRRRFKMMKEQLWRRERELRSALVKQVEDEKKSAVAKIEGKLKPLVERQNKLAEAYAKLYAEAGELGVRIELSTAPRVDIAGYRANYGRSPVQALSGKEAQERLDALKEEAGWSKLSLDELEWQLDEQLAVGELESGTAQDFLAALPTVETLLPLPTGITLPEIETGTS